jgi:hypothetical protein
MLEHNYAGPRCLVYRERLLRCSARLPLCLFTAVFIACLAACRPNKPTVPGCHLEPAFVYQWRTRPRCSVRATPYELDNDPDRDPVDPQPAMPARWGDPAGNVAVGDISGNISIFNAPVTGSASASATFRTVPQPLSRIWPLTARATCLRRPSATASPSSPSLHFGQNAVTGNYQR